MRDITEASAYVCNRCGKAYEEAGHARLCAMNHIPPKNIMIQGAEGREGSGRIYSEGDRWPTILRLWCHQSQTVVLYKRVHANKQPDFGDRDGSGKRSPVVI